jgi:ankyrin repeat protein
MFWKECLTLRWVSAITTFVATLALSLIFLSYPNVRHRRQAALIATALNGNAERIKLLLTVGANVESPACEGPTCVKPLVAAALGGHPEAVNLLLERGADVNGKSKEGQTALIVAAYEGYADTVTLLLARGADPNAKWDGYTALEFARQRKHQKVVEILVKVTSPK